MKNGKKRSPRPRGSRRGGRILELGAESHPPEFMSTISSGHVFRFITAAGAFGPVPVTRRNLLNLYSMAATTTSQYRIIGAIKLNRVRVWGQPAALGSVNSPILVEWLGTDAPSAIHSDTASGVAASYVDTKPPRNSSSRWWSTSGAANENDTLFNIKGPTGTVVDIHCSIRFVDDEAATPSEAGTGAASTVGTVYFNYLDGFASKKLAPDGGVTVLP